MNEIILPNGADFFFAARDEYRTSQVLCYDDNPANIDAARKLGIDAVRVKGFNTVLDELTTRNIITRD